MTFLPAVYKDETWYIFGDHLEAAFFCGSSNSVEIISVEMAGNESNEQDTVVTLSPFEESNES